MATVKTNTDVFEKAWEGFKGTDWKEKQVSHVLYKLTTPHTMAMNLSWLVLLNAHFTSKSYRRNKSTL